MDNRKWEELVEKAIKNGFIDYDPLISKKSPILFYKGYGVWHIPIIDTVLICKIDDHSTRHVRSEEQADKVKQMLKTWEAI